MNQELSQKVPIEVVEDHNANGLVVGLVLFIVEQHQEAVEQVGEKLPLMLSHRVLFGGAVLEPSLAYGEHELLEPTD